MEQKEVRAIIDYIGIIMLDVEKGNVNGDIKILKKYLNKIDNIAKRYANGYEFKQPFAY